MEELRIYLNGLSRGAQENFALRCGTTIGYLRKTLSLNTELGPLLCSLIEQESDQQVTRVKLRPNDWQKIWPELATKAA
ncbi:transcriptional regulator [Leminorella grimontii]|uniref:transcriptional regulator n=1 Tax=Leminorella grimontii TaxID=82981 RepID=UPI0020855515|nr:helix-turn-helix domain-containing protein [Leminorella grimontii]GKX58372.1 hypothetical protein SOASR031_06870 [Leminorella grimontii]